MTPVIFPSRRIILPSEEVIRYLIDKEGIYEVENVKMGEKYEAVRFSAGAEESAEFYVAGFKISPVNIDAGKLKGKYPHVHLRFDRKMTREAFIDQISELHKASWANFDSEEELQYHYEGWKKHFPYLQLQKHVAKALENYFRSQFPEMIRLQRGNREVKELRRHVAGTIYHDNELNTIYLNTIGIIARSLDDVDHLYKYGKWLLPKIADSRFREAVNKAAVLRDEIRQLERKEEKLESEISELFSSEIVRS